MEALSCSARALVILLFLADVKTREMTLGSFALIEPPSSSISTISPSSLSMQFVSSSSMSDGQVVARVLSEAVPSAKNAAVDNLERNEGFRRPVPLLAPRKTLQEGSAWEFWVQQQAIRSSVATPAVGPLTRPFTDILDPWAERLKDPLIGPRVDPRIETLGGKSIFKSIFFNASGLQGIGFNMKSSAPALTNPPRKSFADKPHILHETPITRSASTVSVPSNCLSMLAMY